MSSRHILKKAFSCRNIAAFSLIEIAVVIGILSTLFVLVSPNLLKSRSVAVTQASELTIEADIKAQQTRAMVGDSAGGAQALDYGIYFASDRYVLFRGTSYDPTESSNFDIELEEGVEFIDILFPSQALVFEKGSGEVVGYSVGADSVGIRNSRENTTKTLRINRLGVITALD